jgi:predicted NAD/FAD-binding protein
MLHYHVQPGYSIDADSSSISQYCTRAVEHGKRAGGISRVKRFHPSASILAAARNAGLTAFTVGLDAHRLVDLDYEVRQVCALLKTLGVNPATCRLR